MFFNFILLSVFINFLLSIASTQSQLNTTEHFFFTLANGHKIPHLGLGTALSLHLDVRRAVKAALDEGYRLIDTAHIYGNEAEIGEALQEYLESGKLNRSDIFLSTKLWVTHTRPEDVEPALRESLRKLRVDYVDMYLIHLPCAMQHDDKTQDSSVRIEDTWKAMEAIYVKNLSRAIGVSNFNESQIERIQRIASVKIHNSQVETHLGFQQQSHLELCRRHGIVMTAYAPLGSPGSREFNESGVQAPLKNELVLRLAEKHKKTPAQILLRHLHHRGLVVVPKSIHLNRIHDNAQFNDFQLDDSEITELNNVSQSPRYFKQDFCIGHLEDPFASERKTDE